MGCTYPSMSFGGGGRHFKPTFLTKLLSMAGMIDFQQRKIWLLGLELPRITMYYKIEKVGE